MPADRNIFKTHFLTITTIRKLAAYEKLYANKLNRLREKIWTLKFLNLRSMITNMEKKNFVLGHWISLGHTG